MQTKNLNRHYINSATNSKKILGGALNNRFNWATHIGNLRDSLCKPHHKTEKNTTPTLPIYK